MLRMEEKRAGEGWALDDDTEPLSLQTSPARQYIFLNCRELGFCYLEPNSSYLIHRLSRKHLFSNPPAQELPN